ncbi:Ig-like domain-containing protein [Sphingomonas sp. KR3-1]|uniref:Ig-like domain-containing protein n=1 Tax=Sphingomonas sp. KR3-1 TaxID=3156611 RepID=UPI0032B49E9D
MGSATLPVAVHAASTGCNAVNSGVLNHSTTYTTGSVTSTTAKDSDSSSTLQYVRSNTTYTETANIGLDHFAPNDTTTYSFTAGDVISFTITATSHSGSNNIRAQLRYSTGGTTTALSAASVSSVTSASNSGTIPAGTVAAGISVSQVGGAVNASGVVNITATCTPAASAPTLSSFTYGSTVAYNPSTTTATNIDVGSGGNVQNSPTGYTVSNASGGTYGASAATTGGGSVTINSSGVATYTPRVGYRGNDTFFAIASNSGGNSSPATVTVSVGNPTITASLTGANAKVGTALSGYSVTPSGGNSPYSCALNGGSAALPAGVTLNSNCTLTGTPTTPGTYSFNVDITDSSVTGANGGTASAYTQSNEAITNFVITQDAPTVASLAPSTGSTAGSTSVVLTGTNFYNITAVSFGGTAAGSFVRDSATQITAVSPSHAAGTVNVVVTTSGGTSASAPGNQFIFSVPPNAPVAVTPANGSTIGTTTPNYTGTSDASVTVTVYVDGSSIGTTTSDGAGNWTKVQPTGLSATSHNFRATATNADGLVSANSNTNTFTVTPTPVASSFTASAVAYNVSGTTFSVAGHATNSPTAYAVGSATTAQGGSVSISSAGLVTYTAPTGFRGNDSFTFTATNGGGTSAPATVTVPVSNPTLASSLAGSGTRGIALSGVQINTTGGRAPYTCSTTLASGALPSGTQLNPDCTISGTPASSGNFTFTATVTDSSLGTGPFTQTSGSLTLAIASPTLSMSPAAGALPGATVGTGYSQTFTASGGTSTYSYVATGTVPTGTTLSAGGALTGTPTTAGTFNFTVTATDSSTVGSGGPYTVANNYSVAVAKGSQTITFAALSNASLSASPLTLTATTTSPLTVGFASTTTGVCTVSGTTLTLVATGTCSVTASQAGDANWNAASDVVRSFTVTPANLVITNNAATGLAVGASYSQANPASGGVAPYTYSLSAGAFVPGTTLNGSTGTVSGTPTVAGTFSYIVRATDSQGPAVTADTPVTTVTIAKGTQTISFGALSNASLSASPLTLSASATSGLAVGFASTTTGVCTVSGNSVTLLTTGTCSLTASQAGDSNWNAASDVVRSFTVTPATLVVTPAAPSATIVGTGYSQANPASGGTSPYTYALASGAVPAGTSLNMLNGTVSGTPNTAGAFSYAIQATDSQGTPVTATGATVSGTIAKGSQTITFAALSNASLSASPLTLTATTTSPLTVGFASTTTGVCTVSGTTLTLVATGTCSVTASQAGDANWNAASDVVRSFTVTPANLVITNNAATGLAVGASYSQANPASGGVAPYTYSLSAGAFVPGTTLNASTGTVSGTPTVAGTFSYIVRATDSQGPAVTADTPVTTVTIAKGTQTISFTSTAPVGVGVGGASYTVSATASSGLSVSFTLDGASTGCALSGNTVTFVSTGTCVLDANQAGDSNWNAATQAQQSFTVNAAGAIGATLSFAPSTLGVGATGTATLSFTNPNASASPNIAPLLSGSALLTRGALGGSCGASGSDAGANFQFNGFSIPAGGCTVTLDYTGTTAGSSAGLALGAFTPSGYPTTPSTPGNSFVVVPTVTGVSPPSGPVSQVVTVSGTGFSTAPGNNTVNFGAAAGTVTAASPTSLTVTAPATGSGAVNVTVTVNGQTSPTPGAFTFIDKPITANKPGVAVAYDTATAIDLSASISGGPHSSIAIGTAPTHGSTSIAGDVVTYTPTAGYFGTDSFTYTATGAGGTSNVSTVGLTVATPAAPTAAAKPGVAVPYNSPGTGIDLSTSITGVHSSIAIGTAPAHGTVSIAGDVVTYTPATNYYGVDSFTYTATGPGGTSSPATVGLNVATPPAPVSADKTGVAVPYASTGTAIDLSTSITGVHSGIAIGTAPAHGTVTIASDVVTYTPNPATYYGADSFTYTATGPGGTSAPATVSLTVATPAAPVAANKTGVAVPYASTGTGIDLSASVTGVHASIAIGTAPAHGTVSIAGDVVTYAPNPATYFGADSFTYTATGPGGTSAPATVSLTVATPAAPVAADKPGVAVPYASTGTAIDLSASITGVHASIAIGTAPAHGTASISGDVVTYTPTTGYFGADSFTYTATGPGGPSNVATVSLSVTTPAAPVAANKPGVAVPYASTGTAIDLSASITGVHGSIAIGTAPAHGTVSIAGDVVTYTPAATYFGADSFTYTATGPGGTSAPATVSLTVATPPAPTAADKSGVAVPYASSGTAIDLSASVTGVHSSIAIGTAPSHGTVTIAGDVVTYTPAAAYYGADSFTYTATGPGGSSAPATVNLTVATPAAPVGAARSGVAVAYNSPGTAIDLSSSVTGVHATLTISTPPTHGSATVSGDVVTYVPATGYYGADSFGYTVTGPGGTSSEAAVGLNVATPPPPAAQPGTGTVAGSTTTTGTSVQINLSSLVTGVYTSIQIASQPAHGTVTLSGGAGPLPGAVAAPVTPYIATYTPAAGYVGSDSFTFTATGPGGTSAPGTVAITVVGSVPVATPKTATAGDGQMVSVMLTDGAQRGPFTGATVVSVSPANSASTAIVAASGGYRLDVTPNNRFGGTIVVTYTLSNAYGASAPSTVTLTVQARPDPRNDPNVGAISDAQSEATRRFARAQVSNFMRRTEQLHHGGGTAGMAMGVSLASRDGSAPMQRPDDKDWGLAITERMRMSGEDPAIGRFANDPNSPLSRSTQLGYDRNVMTSGTGVVAGSTPGGKAAAPGKPVDADGGDGTRRIGSVATWAGGAIDIGTRDKTTDRSKVTATTAGLSAGADIKLAEGVVVGVGGGYGSDTSEIGTAARVRSTSTLYAAYASLEPASGMFVDGVIGRGQLDFTTRRLAAAVDATARGSRDGSYTVAAISLGADRTTGALQWSIYGRGEYLDANLDAYTETGAGRYNLRFDARDVRSVTGTLGARFEYRQKVSFGSITPRVRAEWNHEFADVDAQWLDYADIPGAAAYALAGNGWKREQLQLSIGTRFDILRGGWSFDFETGLRTGQGEKAGTLQLRLSKQF